MSGWNTARRLASDRAGARTSIDRPNQSKVEAQYIDAGIRLGHAEIGVMREIQAAGHSQLLAQLIAYAKLGEPVECEILALAARPRRVLS